MSPTVFVVLIIYLIIIFLIGLWAGKKSNSMTDFLLAGRSLKLWMAIMTISASWFGGGLLIGMGQKTYTSGYVMFFYPLNSLFGLVFAGLLIKKMKDFTSYTTVTEFLEYRYKSPMLRLLCSLLSLVALIGLVGSQVTSVVSVLTSLGASNPTMTAICTTIVLVIYTSVGGFLAVTLTDCFQIILVIGGVIAACTVALIQNGGIGTIVAALETQSASLPDGFTSIMGSGGLSFIIFLVLPPTLYALIGQDLYQRLFACESLKTARKAAIISGILVCLLTFVPATMGLIARVLYPELAESGRAAMAIPMIIINHLPDIGVGIVLAAILAAIMSTADSLISSATSHFMNDVWVRYIDKSGDVNSKSLLIMSRVFTAFVGLAAMIVALILPDIITLCVHSYTLYTAGAFCPIVLGVLWKKATKEGAFAGLFVGVILAVAGISGFSLAGIPTILLGGISSLVVMVVVSLLTYKEAGAGTTA